MPSGVVTTGESPPIEWVPVGVRSENVQLSVALSRLLFAVYERQAHTRWENEFQIRASVIVASGLITVNS